MTIKELLDLFYKMQESGKAQLDSIELLDENKYELSINSDWIDGRRSYNKIFVVDADTGVTSSNYYDDIIWDIEVMYKEQMEKNELMKKRQAVLDKLTAEERDLLGLWHSLKSYSPPDCLYSVRTKPMITTKAQMLKVIATCAQPHVLTREEKFQVFCRVCDNMLAEGRITKANHTRWTNVF